jgi:hypothetical protein
MERSDEANHADASTSTVRRLAGKDALRAHLTLIAGLALCAAAFWFELGRAEGGNELSWAYVFEWPLLGVFGVYMWWNVLDPQRRVRAKAKKKTTTLAPEFHGMLSAWEQHQRELLAQQNGNELHARKETDSTS